LPDESVLRGWASKVDASPGFTELSFRQLKLKVEEAKGRNQKVIVQLVLDEMSIRQHVQFDGNKFIGIKLSFIIYFNCYVFIAIYIYCLTIC
jgi:hypothetical protein